MVAACPFPSLRGSQVLIREMAERLAAAGHFVSVVTYPTAQHLAPLRRIGIHRVPKLPGLWTARPFGWQKIVLDLLLVFRLFQVVRRERIQVIHAHNFEGPVLAYVIRWLTGIPVVYHAHNALSDELPRYARSAWGRRFAAWLGSCLDHRVAAAADWSVALTDRLAAFLAARGAVGRIAVIPPGTVLFQAALGDRRPDRHVPRIAYAGNLDPYQDLDVLLRGFEQVRASLAGAELVVVTHEPASSRIRKRAVELGARAGVRVHFAPTFPAARRLLAECDVLVCARSSWSGFPIKVLNYMALGLPIVHARGSAHPIEHEVSGLLFEDNDPADLAGAALRILGDPALARRLGAAARAVARERYAWPHLISHVEEVYERVVPPWRGIETRKPASSRGAPGWTDVAVANGGRPRTGWYRLDPMVRSRRSAACRTARKRSKEWLMNGLGGFIRRHVHWGRRHVVRPALAVLAVWLLVSTLGGCGSSRSETLAPLPPLTEQPSALPSGSDLYSEYQLMPGDVLRVKFRYHPELDVKVPVRPDGHVAVNGVGVIRAQGRTAEDLGAEIERISSETLREPEVTVMVAELGAHRVYVAGEVRNPGFVLFREGMTPIQAIFERGGFTDVARTDSVLKVSYPTGVEPQATRLDFKKTLKEGATELHTLAANDVLYVPRTFIGDANAFVRLYIRNLVPVMPRPGIGFAP